jgi:hypothetical protein
MTDKMPVVTLFFEDGNGNKIDYHLTTWDRIFEELPASNSQEKEKVSEVEKALEELKERLSFHHHPFCDKLFSSAQNLVTALEAEKDMSKPEPEIDMKEECVEAKEIDVPTKSIWKDVKEVIDNQSIIYVNKAGFARLGEYWNDTMYFIEGDSGDVRAHAFDKGYYVKKFCTLTDFVNQVEDMEARLRKLEGK